MTNAMHNAAAAPPVEGADPYPSRVDDRWEIAGRQDPVVWGEGEDPLPRAQLEGYEEAGFLQFESLLGERETAGLLAEAQRLADTADRRATGVVTEPGGDTVRSVFRIHRNNDVFRRVCEDPRLVDVARQILGGEVYVHQSRINYKPAFDGKEFFWHSDFETWHVEDGMPRMRAVSVSLSLTDSTEFNGPLMLVPKSHRRYVRCVGATPEDHFRQSLRKQEYGVPDREALAELVEAGGIVAPKGAAGSAVVFDSNTMHGSSGNLSPYPRVNLFVVYNSIENALVAPFGGTTPRPEFLAERGS